MHIHITILIPLHCRTMSPEITLSVIFNGRFVNTNFIMSPCISEFKTVGSESKQTKCFVLCVKSDNTQYFSHASYSAIVVCFQFPNVG